MALIILDPNLEGEAGHHLAYDLAIAREAMARGEPATIIANRRFAATTIGGFAVLMVSPLPLLRDFGVIVTLNVAIALLAALVVSPMVAY